MAHAVGFSTPCNCVQHDECIGRLEVKVYKDAQIATLYFTPSQFHNGFDLAQENMRHVAAMLTGLATKMQPLQRGIEIQEIEA